MRSLKQFQIPQSGSYCLLVSALLCFLVARSRMCGFRFCIESLSEPLFAVDGKSLKREGIQIVLHYDTVACQVVDDYA